MSVLEASVWQCSARLQFGEGPKECSEEEEAVAPMCVGAVSSRSV